MSFIVKNLEGFKKALKISNWMNEDIIFNIESEKIILYTPNAARTSILEYEHLDIINNDFPLDHFKIKSDLLTKFSFRLTNNESIIFELDKEKKSNNLFFGKYHKNNKNVRGFYEGLVHITETEPLRNPIKPYHYKDRSIIQLNNDIYSEFIKDYRLLKAEALKINLKKDSLHFLSEKSIDNSYKFRLGSNTDSYKILEFMRPINHKFPFENIDKLGNFSNEIILELYNMGSVLNGVLVFNYKFGNNSLKYITISWTKDTFLREEIYNFTEEELRHIAIIKDIIEEDLIIDQLNLIQLLLDKLDFED